MNIKPDPNNWHLEIFPRSAGDFGSCSISSIQYDEREARDAQRDMENAINRHVDRVRHINVVYDGYLCECGNYFDNKQDAEECCKDNN